MSLAVMPDGGAAPRANVAVYLSCVNSTLRNRSDDKARKIARFPSSSSSSLSSGSNSTIVLRGVVPNDDNGSE